MSLRAALALSVLVSLSGCVSSGQVDPLSTESGREEARRAYVQLGLGYLKQGDPERAKAPLSKALELDPSNANAHAALALVFQTQMEAELADKHYREALQRSDDARILNNYGSFLFEQGRYEEALARFEQASRDTLYDERSHVFENMGLTALKLGRKEQARKYFARAVRLNARQQGALLELASLAYESKDYVPAKEYYDRFVRLGEENARSLLLGIRLANIFQKPSDAASLGLRLQRLYPSSAEYRTYLSEQR